MPSAGRVTGGTARGLRLVGPGAGTRPLSDRVKQSLFGGLAGSLGDARVLDLFAGSGAAGIEALSRGAEWCDFVDDDRSAIASVDANLRTTGLAGRAAVHRGDAVRFVERAGGGTPRYALVIVDPPYGDPVMLAALEVLGRGTVLTPEAIVVAKHFWRDEMPDVVGRLQRQRDRRFGETVLSWYGVSADGASRP